MEPAGRGFEVLTQRFVEWAKEEEGIRSALILGSRARADHPADASSDLDIAILVVDPQPYLSGADWVRKIGQPWLTFIEHTGDGHFYERRVLFEGGYDVDFAFFPVEAMQGVLTGQFPADLADILQRGVSVILDKDGLAAQLIAAAPKPPLPAPPSRDEFLNLVDDFWYHTVWTAKKLQRGELWTAKFCCDSYMKWRLLRMVEWHARLLHGQDYDTWHSGRFLEEWADPRLVEGLRPSFSAYDEAGLWRALFATMDLFHWLALETAQRLGYPYPSSGEERATQLVTKIKEIQGADSRGKTRIFLKDPRFSA